LLFIPTVSRQEPRWHMCTYMEKGNMEAMRVLCEVVAKMGSVASKPWTKESAKPPDQGARYNMSTKTHMSANSDFANNRSRER
jgi:hypothetical protein